MVYDVGFLHAWSYIKFILASCWRDNNGISKIEFSLELILSDNLRKFGKATTDNKLRIVSSHNKYQISIE